MYTEQDLINAYKAGILESAYNFATWHDGELICGVNTNYKLYKISIILKDFGLSFVKKEANYIEEKAKELHETSNMVRSTS